MSKHYCYGSGMFGCLYDYGPHFSPDIDGAIEDLLFMFGDQLEEGEAERMASNLNSDRMHRFENPLNAGAQYCEISVQSGECPDNCD